MFDEFWRDPKQSRDLSPEDRYVYLWCLTNPHNNLCGCYRVTIERAAQELGYTPGAAVRIIGRLDGFHQLIRYSYKTGELLLLHWNRLHKVPYENTAALQKEIQQVKNPGFRNYLFEVYAPGEQSESADKPEESPIEEKKPQPAPKPKKVDVFGEFAGEDENLLDALRDFEKMRNTKGRKMTDRARKILVSKLEREFSPEEWIAVLEQSVFRCWDSVYRLEEEPGEQKKSSTEYSEDPSDIDLLLGDGGET